MTCKVDRVSEEYGLQNVDDRLKRRYGQEGVGVRQLETYLNQRILRKAMVNTRLRVLDGMVENYYRLLTDDDVMEADRTEARHQLEREGLDIESVEADFVSYQTVRKHLNTCLGVDTSRPSPSVNPVKARERVNRLAGRVNRVISNTISRLREHGVLDLGEPDVIVSVKIRCDSCGRTYDAQSLFSRGSCACKEASTQNKE